MGLTVGVDVPPAVPVELPTSYPPAVPVEGVTGVGGGTGGTWTEFMLCPAAPSTCPSAFLSSAAEAAPQIHNETIIVNKKCENFAISVFFIFFSFCDMRTVGFNVFMDSLPRVTGRALTRTGALLRPGRCPRTWLGIAFLNHSTFKR